MIPWGYSRRVTETPCFVGYARAGHGNLPRSLGNPGPVHLEAGKYAGSFTFPEYRFWVFSGLRVTMRDRSAFVH